MDRLAGNGSRLGEGRTEVGHPLEPVFPGLGGTLPETFAENSNHSLQHWICDPEAPDDEAAVDARPGMIRLDPGR